MFGTVSDVLKYVRTFLDFFELFRAFWKLGLLIWKLLRAFVKRCVVTSSFLSKTRFRDSLVTAPLYTSGIHMYGVEVRGAGAAPTANFEQHATAL